MTLDGSNNNNGNTLEVSDPPFQTCLFPSPSASGSPSDRITRHCENLLWEHFPVSFRSGAFDEEIYVVNDHATLSRFLETEFSLERLDVIYPKLWRVGFPRPPRSLSTQIQMGRTVVLTNAIDMHLVWGGGKIFLKPLPRYLLESEFWTILLPSSSASGHDERERIVEPKTDGTASAEGQSGSAAESMDRSVVRQSALGLLYTYACLITHPVDLKMALDLGLIPKDGVGNGNGPDWATWRKLATELLQPGIRRQLHRRFERGELRLNRLNWIYVFRDVPSFQMYYSPWYNYTDFLVANLSWITATTIYIAIVLTAMQVGLSTDALKNSQAFQNVSYGFTVFAILGPIVAISLVLLILLVFVVPNWNSARSASRQLEPTSEAITKDSPAEV
ncbi:hypothetical protein F4777DRAFT_382425 [Nemania sp. FL0916]|nr:hypothetical protein F4777DRAFT_382425 [Nemania sp. FL0916]